MTAKALASKLNERNNMLNGSKKGSLAGGAGGGGGGKGSSSGPVNDIPVPPLISIQMTSTSNRFKDGDDSQHRDLNLHQNKGSQPKSTLNATGAQQKSNDAKQEQNDISFNGTGSLHLSKTVILSF